jgi:predicted HicB family RNase H-like nuclease
MMLILSRRKAVAEKSGTEPTEETLQIKIPASTKRELALRATQERITLRTLVLRALAQYGFSVPPAEMQDRRKTR